MNSARSQQHTSLYSRSSLDVLKGKNISELPLRCMVCLLCVILGLLLSKISISEGFTTRLCAFLVCFGLNV